MTDAQKIQALRDASDNYYIDHTGYGRDESEWDEQEEEE